MVISELFRTELLDIREKVDIFILHEGVEQFVISFDETEESHGHPVSSKGRIFLTCLIFLLYVNYDLPESDFFYLFILDRLYFFLWTFNDSFENLFLHTGQVFYI